MNRYLRNARLIACGTAYELGSALLRLSKRLEVPTPTAFKTNVEIDASQVVHFTEGEHYSGTRPGFIP